MALTFYCGSGSPYAWKVWLVHNLDTLMRTLASMTGMRQGWPKSTACVTDILALSPFGTEEDTFLESF